MTQAQNAAGGLQYVNELLVRSDEPFVRFFPGHFSSIRPEQHGLPLPKPERQQQHPSAERRAEGHGTAKCNLTGVWYDLHNAGKYPTNRFELKLVASSANQSRPSWRIDQPNEWSCEVFVNGTKPSASPPTPPVQRVPGHPECGVDVPAHAPQPNQFGFFWPAHGATPDTLQYMAPTLNCQYLCFTNPRAAAQNGGLPYARTTAPAPPGICNFATGGGSGDSAATPWLNASFSGLRVKGAQGTEACPLSLGLCTFLVGASLSTHGEVSDIDVFSERGGNFTFLSPFPASATLVVEERHTDATVKVSLRKWAPPGLFHLEAHETVFAFETKAKASYVISRQS